MTDSSLLKVGLLTISDRAYKNTRIKADLL